MIIHGLNSQKQSNVTQNRSLHNSFDANWNWSGIGVYTFSMSLYRWEVIDMLLTEVFFLP